MIDRIFKLKVDTIGADKARLVLEPVSQDRAFYTTDGLMIDLLQQLAEAIEIMPAAAYIYHANLERNDFATWIREVLGDSWLADKLTRAKDQARAGQIIAKRLAYLQKLAESN